MNSLVFDNYPRRSFHFVKELWRGDGNTDGMKASADAGTQKAAELSSKLEALKAEKAQLDQELSEHQSSRETAKQDSKKAANLRAKEKAEFEETSADMSNNIGAMKGAIAALEKGTLGLFGPVGGLRV